jgi:hypothetical protein
MVRLSRRVKLLAARLVLDPDPPFLAFARTALTWNGALPREDEVRAFALADEAPPEVPPVDPTRLTPVEREAAARIAGIVAAGGLAVLSDADLDLAECLRHKLDGGAIATCLV